MKTLGKIIVAFIPLVVVAIIAYNLNREEPDLRFSLSQNIPTKFLSESQRESVQLLELINLGDKIAEKIIIKINKSITDYDLSKYSINDSIRVENTEGLFELFYSELPPQGTFKVILKSKGEGINQNDLLINYSHGQASYLLKNEDGGTLLLFIIIGFTLVYLLLTINSIKNMVIEDLERDARFYNPKTILIKKKPFYLYEQRWTSIRKEAIKNFLEKEYYFSSSQKIEDSEIYKILNSNKFDYLSDEEWETLQKNAEKKFEDLISNVLSNSYFIREFEKIINLKKPKDIEETDWEKTKKRISEVYLGFKKEDIRNLYDAKKIINEFKLDKPKIILTTIWDEYIKYCQEIYYDFIIKKIDYKKNPFESLKSFSLEYLSKDQNKSLEDFAYRLSIIGLPNLNIAKEAELFLKSDKPNWINDKDYEQFKQKAETTIEYGKNKDEFISLIKYIIKLLSEGKTTEFNSTVLKDFEKSEFELIINEFENFHLNKKIIKKESNELVQLKEKITKQLNVINDCLTDPKSLERIEDYENIFSSGNFENLKKIAYYKDKMDKES